MRVGLSCSAITLNDENFENMKKSGIDAVEIGIGGSFCQIMDYKAISEFAKKSGVELWSAHLPFVPGDKFHMAAHTVEERRAVIERHTEIIKKVAAVGVDKFVVHPSCEPIEDEDRAEYIKRSQESFYTLAENAAREGAIIAVEDLPRTCLGRESKEMLELISVNDKLRVCFDTNHLMIEDNPTFIRKLADKIITVHVSDFDFINERHWLPGEGKLVWKPIYDALCEIGYTGPWLYEVGLKCPKTIIRERDLTYADFYENAQTIFSGKEPTMPDFSTHKEHIGMWE